MPAIRSSSRPLALRPHLAAVLERLGVHVPLLRIEDGEDRLVAARFTQPLVAVEQLLHLDGVVGGELGGPDCLVVDPWNALGTAQVFAYVAEVAALRA